MKFNVYRHQSFSAHTLVSNKDTHIRTGDMVHHIVGRIAQQLRNDAELVDMVLPREHRSTQEHLAEDAPGTPDIDFLVVPPPGEHDLRGAVVPGGDVAGHLVLADAGKTEVADFQVAVLVDQDVARFEVAVDHTG